jgi:hypothetical protein
LCEVGTTRSESEQQTAQVAKQIAECGITFSMNYPESDAQLQSELRKLRGIVDRNDKSLSERLSCRSCSSDSDLVVVNQRRSAEMLMDESWEEDQFILVTKEPPLSIRVFQP